MHTIEYFLQGKYDNPRICEDQIIMTENLTAIIDGATAKGERLWCGQKSGRFAATILGEYISDNSDWIAFGSAEHCFKALTDVLRAQINHSLCEGEILDIKDYPRASVIILSGPQKEVWSYGDCQCMIGEVPHSIFKEVDWLASSVRSFVLEQAILKGMTADNLLLHDIGRESIRQILETQFYFENKCMRFGYPVINGIDFNPALIKIYPVSSDDQIVLASDGYPKLFSSLAESEQHLRKILLDDPLCFRENPGTKGLQPGMVSFDDRAYWRGLL